MKNVVVIGFGKSATTTLHKAFSKTGYNSFHQNVKHLRRTVPELMVESYRESGDPYAFFRDNLSPYALTQLDYTNPSKNRVIWPQLDYEMLVDGFEKNDDVVYVLNYREPYSLADSFFRWKDGQFRDRLIRADLPGLPSGTGYALDEIVEWTSAHYEKCRELFEGSDRYIEVDIQSDDFRTDLESFLEIEFKWWGVANKNVQK